MTGRPNDERAPLLERDDQVETGDTSATPQEKRTWWIIGWYTVFALLGTFAVAVFVKGVIDSDDVDVSTPLFLNRKNMCIASDWKGFHPYMRSQGATFSMGRRCIEGIGGWNGFNALL